MTFSARSVAVGTAVLVAAGGLSAAGAQRTADVAVPVTVEKVVSAGAPGSVRFTLPANRRGHAWALLAAKLVGDLNGDRVPDLAFVVDHVHHTGPVNVRSCEPIPHGRFVQVIFGGALPPRIDLTRPGVAGFRIGGLPGNRDLGSALAGIGDLNGDGRGDLVLGAPGDTSSAGTAYVVYGKASTAPVDVSRLGPQGFTLAGSLPWGQAGMTVAGGGDVNGDGRADVLIGAQWRSRELIDQLQQRHCAILFIPEPASMRSVVYAVFGGSRTGTIELGDLGSNGFEIKASPRLLAAEGAWLANIGDMNGDRLADIGIGARSGAVVVLGRKATDRVDVARANDVIQLHVPRDPRSSTVIRSLDGAGDVNGDGLGDFLIGAEGARDADSPSAYLVFGRRSTAPIDVRRLGRGGIVLHGSSNSGNGLVQSVFGLGDLDGDRVPDAGVLARTSYGGRGSGGSLYVVHGRRSSGTIALRRLGSAGARIDGSPGTPLTAFGGVADVLPGPGRELLVLGYPSAALVPYAPVAAKPAPRLAASIDLGRYEPIALAGGLGAIWVAAHVRGDRPDRPAGYLLRVDPQTNRIAGSPVSLGLPPTALTAALGSLWVTVVPIRRGRPAMLLRIEPESGRVLYRRPLGPKRAGRYYSAGPESIQYASGSLWITYRMSGHVDRVDPASGKAIASIRIGLEPKALTFAAGKLWVVDRQDGAVRELDPERNRVVGAPLQVSGYDTSNRDGLGDTLWLGTRSGRVWIYDPSRPGLVVLDPRTRRFAAKAPSPAAGSAFGIAQAGPVLWLLDRSGVGRIGLDDGLPIGSRLELRTGSRPTVFYGGSLWTTSARDNGLVRIDAPRGGP